MTNLLGALLSHFAGLLSAPMTTNPNVIYLKEVLGVESVLADKNADLLSQNAMPVEGSGSIFFLGEQTLSNPNQKELLYKMVAAMGYSPKQVYVAECNEFTQSSYFSIVETFSPVAIVVLGHQKNLNEDFESPASKVFYTHSLQSLQQNADLKKETWAELKKVMNYLKSQTLK